MTDEQKPADDCQKCAEYLAGWKRALADYDNLKKDLARERATIHEGAREALAHELLPVIDHFDQAVRFRPAGLSKDVETWLTGILHVRTQLESVLTSMGLTPFGEVGEAFDAHAYESVAQRKDETKPDQTIIEVTQRGWRLGSSIIRPAKVTINCLDSIT